MATPASVDVLTEQPTSWASPQLTDLRRFTAGLRDNLSLLHGTSESLHRDVQEFDLRDRTALKNQQGVAFLLEELSSGRGMAWNDIATAVGVSLSALRKWRSGGDCGAPNRVRLARVSALLDLVEEAMVAEPAGWLLTPVLPDFTITFMDLIAAGRDDLVLEVAFHRKSPSEVLDDFKPGWRDDSRRIFDIRMDGDGIRSLVRRRR